MDSTTTSQSGQSKQKSLGGRILDVLSGLRLATYLFLALFLLTWFATLEQTVIGLKPMMDKYFDWKSLFFFPEIGKPFQEDGILIPMKVYIPMLSGFWLCVLFTLNLTLGGLIRFRKSPKKIGILISHFSIVFLMIAAGVTHFSEERGALQIYEGGVSDAAQDYHAQVIEISELSQGVVTQVHLVDWEYLEDLTVGGERLFRMKDLPFDLKVSNFLENAQPNPVQFVPPIHGEKVIDGFYLKKLPKQAQTEAHLSGCIITVQSKSGESLSEKILASRSIRPATMTVEGQPYLLRLRKKLWPLPFKVQLDDFRVERDPGTSRAAAYESDVTRIKGEEREEVLIQMNEPMRREGWTFFQANWGPQDQENPAQYYSVLEVVRNPADHWPLYSLIVAIVGLFWQFGSKLFSFIRKSQKSV